MEIIKAKPSIFSYEEEMKLTLAEGNIGNIGKAIPGEAVVVQALYGYRFLTKNLLSKNLKLYGHESLNIDRLLSMLIENGTVEHFNLKGTSPPDLDFYTLSDIAMEEYYGVCPYIPENVSEVLADMALSQWHMSALKDKRVKQYFHNHTESTGETSINIRSVIFIKTRPPLYIAAHPSPRGNSLEGIKKFLKEVAVTNEFMADKAGIFKSYLQVIICESESQMKDISKLLESFHATRNAYILYSLDEESSSDRNPLERIHTVKWYGDKAQIETVNLISIPKKEK